MLYGRSATRLNESQNSREIRIRAATVPEWFGRSIVIALSGVAFALAVVPRAFGESWTETFDTGVGRLNATTGNGETVFIYDAANQRINATFIRYLHGNNVLDRRFAPFENGPADFANLTVSFEMVVTPLSASSGSNLAAQIGLVHAASGYTEEKARVNFDRNSQTIAPQWGGSSFDPTAGIPFAYGETYYVAARFSGPQRLFTIDVYRDTSARDEFLGRIDRSLNAEPGIPVVYDGIGLVDDGTGSQPSQFAMYIHQISYSDEESDGACCVDSACHSVKRAACDAFGGAYSGVGSVCDDIMCPTICNADLVPCPGGDGLVDIFDILAALDAFSGDDCCNP